MSDPIRLDAPRTSDTQRVVLRVGARQRHGDTSSAIYSAGMTVRLDREDAASLVASGQAVYEEAST